MLRTTHVSLLALSVALAAGALPGCETSSAQDARDNFGGDDGEQRVRPNGDGTTTELVVNLPAGVCLPGGACDKPLASKPTVRFDDASGAWIKQFGTAYVVVPGVVRLELSNGETTQTVSIDVPKGTRRTFTLAAGRRTCNSVGTAARVHFGRLAPVARQDCPTGAVGVDWTAALPGAVTFTGPGIAPIARTLAEGEVNEFSLDAPIVGGQPPVFETRIEKPIGDFPTPADAPRGRIVAPTGCGDGIDITQLKWTANLKAFRFADCTYSLELAGVSVPLSSSGGTVTLGRVDVEDIVLTRADGSTYTQKAWYRIYRGGVDVGGRSFDTGTGVDLLPGTYDIETTYVVANQTRKTRNTIDVTAGTPVLCPATEDCSLNIRIDAPEDRWVSAGSSDTCAIDDSGELYYWGDSRYASPTKTGFPDVARASTGGAGTCVVSTSGNLYCFDTPPAFPALGYSRFAPRLANVADVSVGNGHTCAVTSDHKLFCWGSNSSGELGVGDTTDRGAPTLVALADVAQVAAGEDMTCARTLAGEAYCWGTNKNGALGIGSTDRFALAPRRLGLPAVDGISAGADHGCANTRTGQLYCWGSNEFGQLGLRYKVDDGYPRLVDLADVAQVSSNSHRTCARTRLGELFCWGFLLPDSSSTSMGSRRVPLTDVTQVSVGTNHVCARSTGHALSCWGMNISGQLGITRSTDGSWPNGASVPRLAAPF